MHGPKLNRDWIGLRVKLVREAQNGHGVIAKGTAGTITGYTNGVNGIHFGADPCKHCGCALFITAMRREDFTILPRATSGRTHKGKADRIGGDGEQQRVGRANRRPSDTP